MSIPEAPRFARVSQAGLAPEPRLAQDFRCSRNDQRSRLVSAEGIFRASKVDTLANAVVPLVDLGRENIVDAAASPGILSWIASPSDLLIKPLEDRARSALAM